MLMLRPVSTRHNRARLAIVGGLAASVLAAGVAKASVLQDGTRLAQESAAATRPVAAVNPTASGVDDPADTRYGIDIKRAGYRADGATVSFDIEAYQPFENGQITAVNWFCQVPASGHMQGPMFAYTITVDAPGGRITGHLLDMASGKERAVAVERPSPTTLTVSVPRSELADIGAGASFKVQSLSSLTEAERTAAHLSSRPRDLQDANKDGVVDTDETDQAGSVLLDLA